MSNVLKRTYLYFGTLTLFLHIASLSFAQTFTPGNLEASVIMLPSTGYIETLDSLKNPLRSRHSRFSLGYAFILTQKSDTVRNKFNNLSMNVNANYSSFKSEGNAQGLIPTELLYSELGLVHFSSMKNSWSAIQTVSLGVNTDFRTVDKKDLIINGGFIFMKYYSENFSLGFGAFAYNALSMPILLPGFVVKWQTSGKFKLLINIPTEISGAYSPLNDLEFKIAFRPRNINYDTENKLVKERRALSYWELPIGLEIRKKTSRVDFIVGGGLMALRSFQFNERGLSNFFKSTPAHMLKATYFINAGVQFHLQRVAN
jgi:hypothetical protein